MASALVFPVSTLDASLAEQLSRVFKPLVLYQPVGMPLAPHLRPMVEAKGLILVEPHQSLASESQVRGLLAQLNQWVEGIRDFKEMASLRGWAADAEDGDQGPSALMTAIRRYGRPEDQSPLSDDLVLHLAQEHDRRRRELKEMVNGLLHFERQLGRAMGLKREEGDEAKGGLLHLGRCEHCHPPVYRMTASDAASGARAVVDTVKVQVWVCPLAVMEAV